MKEEIINGAGKTWQFLGQNGETELNALPKRLKEKKEVLFQSLGWLARENKINYAQRDSKMFVSLIDSEMQIFSRVAQNMRQAGQEGHKKTKKLAQKE